MPTQMRTAKSCFRSSSNYIARQCLVKRVRRKLRNTLHCKLGSRLGVMLCLKLTLARKKGATETRLKVKKQQSAKKASRRGFE